MEKFDFKKIVGSFSKKGIPLSKKTRNAKRDWLLLLGVVTILLAGVAAFNVYIFSQVQSGALFITQENDVKVKTIVDEELLNETIDVFREREGKFEEYKSTFPKIPDVN